MKKITIEKQIEMLTGVVTCVSDELHIFNRRFYTLLTLVLFNLLVNVLYFVFIIVLTAKYGW